MHTTHTSLSNRWRAEKGFVHVAAKWLNALSTGSPWQPAEFHRLPTSLADYLLTLPSLLLPSLPPFLPSPSLPSPTPAAPGKRWRGSSLLRDRRAREKEAWKEKPGRERGRGEREKTELRLREGEGAGKKKDKDPPSPSSRWQDTGRVISKQWARKRRSATAIHPPKHDTQSAPRHNRIHLWENGAGLIKCVAERSYYKNSPFESSQSYWWKSGLRSCSAALLLLDFYWNVFNLCICKKINKCVELVRLIYHHIAKTELAYTRQQKRSTASERRHFKLYNT